MNYSNIAIFAESIKEIFDLYRNYGGNDYIGEEVTQLEHALQCAHFAEKEYPDNSAIILGALLHDIGHLMLLKKKDREHVSEDVYNQYGAINHEIVGPDFLKRNGFPESVISLGRNHTIAKRYLITKYPEYYNNLSEASKKTLVEQGGELSLNEINEFEKNENKDLYIQMRHWDDSAKLTDFVYDKTIDYYEDMALKLLIC